MADLESWHKGGRSLWICAAIGALMIHLGGAAFAVTSFRDDDDGAGLGADASAIAIDMSSPDISDDDLPKSDHESQVQNAQQQQEEQKAEVKQTDVEKAIPTTTEEADREVTTSDVKKPTEEAKTATVETHAQDAVEASDESSRKTLDQKTPNVDQAKAPNIGIGKDAARMTAEWGKKISAYFELHKKFPEGKKKGANVVLALVLNRLGNVMSVDVQESSGDAQYDQAAIAMVRRSDPVPKPPSSLTDDQFAFTLPVNFNENK